MAAKKAESKGITVDPERRKTQIKLRKSYLHVTQEWDLPQWELQKFRNRVKAQRPDLTVINTSVDNIPVDCDIERLFRQFSRQELENLHHRHS